MQVGNQRVSSSGSFKGAGIVGIRLVLQVSPKSTTIPHGRSLAVIFKELSSQPRYHARRIVTSRRHQPRCLCKSYYYVTTHLFSARFLFFCILL